MTHRLLSELFDGLDAVRSSPRDDGPIEMIVRRPAVGERVVCEEARLNEEDGLAGDNWRVRGSSRTPDRSSHPDMQITIMNSRLAALVAGPRERWPLAGDQLFVDLDLTEDNLPSGTLLDAGSARLIVTAQPHTGCSKFIERFGVDAMKFLSSPEGKELRLRGIYARVVREGTITVGDRVRKASPG
jgi:hypothetical protein